MYMPATVRIIFMNILLISIIGCKDITKSPIGFWRAQKVLIDGKPKIVIKDDAYVCGDDTFKLVLYAPEIMNLLIQEDGKYAMFLKFKYHYDLKYSGCWWYLDNDVSIVRFTEVGLWSKKDRNTIVLLPDSGKSFISLSGTPYSCEIVQLKRKSLQERTLQLKCELKDWYIDITGDSIIDYKGQYLELTAVSAN